MVFTQIIKEHPGYFWYKTTPQDNWQLGWEPVKGYYSPPKLDKGIGLHLIRVPDEFKTTMGRVIGRLGKHFKWITIQSGTKYIFYRVESGDVEIWGDCEDCVHYAIRLIEEHFTHLRKRMDF